MKFITLLTVLFVSVSSFATSIQREALFTLPNGKSSVDNGEYSAQVQLDYFSDTLNVTIFNVRQEDGSQYDVEARAVELLVNVPIVSVDPECGYEYRGLIDHTYTIGGERVEIRLKDNRHNICEGSGIVRGMIELHVSIIGPRGKRSYFIHN